MSSQNRIFAEDEWSPLKTVLVGRAEHSRFAREPKRMIEATMPEKFWKHFAAGAVFPPEVVKNAQQELDQLASILEKLGIKVYRPQLVDWTGPGGYTGAMSRDELMVVGDVIIESHFAWQSRRREVDLCLGRLLTQLANDDDARVVRMPDYGEEGRVNTMSGEWAIDNSRPAFDAADFMRLGKTILCQRSHVTNQSGIDFVRKVVPAGYSVEELEVDDEHAMHIDATLLPLREGLMAFNTERTSEQAIRKHSALRDWKLVPFPAKPAEREWPPLYMTSSYIAYNLLVLDGKRVIVEEQDVEVASWLRGLGMEPILCPFTHVNSIGGSFHCATVDLLRES